MTVSSAVPEHLIADRFFEPLKRFVIDATGLFYYAAQDLELARCFAARFDELRLTNCGAYWSLLHDTESGEVELDRLIAQLTIGETFFFRHLEQFQAICEVAIPEIIARNRSMRRMRIWSAGCAVGAEPYSLAILLKQNWPEVFADWDIEIFGTDINRSFLAEAREGRFHKWALRATPLEIVDRYFSRAGSSFIVKPELRKRVAFGFHNLVKDLFPPKCGSEVGFDLILCRNVLIYFSTEATQRIIDQFFECLPENGWLVVGHAESNTQTFQRFQTINASDAVLYQKFAARPQIVNQGSLAGPRPEQQPPAKYSSCGSVASRQHESKTFEQIARPADQTPLDPAQHFEKAIDLLKRGRVSDAEHAFRRTLYLDRGFVSAHYYLGLLLKRRGEPLAAQRCFRNALRLLNPNGPPAKRLPAHRPDSSAIAEISRIHCEELNAK